MTKARALAMRQTSGALAHRLFAATTLAVVLAAALIVSQARGDGHTTTSHGISAFGDLKYPADFPHFDYVNPDAPKGGTFSSRGTGASNTFDSLNAYILKGEPAQGLGLLYDTLLVGSADEPDSAYGLIAESLEYPEDRSWVTFNMREEAQFSDGTPLTSADVVWTFNTLIEKGVPSFKIRYQDVESVEALGPHQVKFTFKSDAVSFRDLPATMGGMPILPMHYYAERDFAESTMKFPVGSGAYVVDEAQPGRMIRYCRNPDYWGADLPVNVGTYNFECIVYEYFADRTAAFEALKSGTYLFHEEFYSKIWATEYNFPSLEKGWVIQESIPDARPSGTQGYWINTRREKFADPRVREAIGKLFNFEWSNETLFYGIYDRTDSFWENAQNMQATGMAEGKERAILEEYRDLLPASVLEAEAFTPGIYPPARVPRSAIRAAKRLMEEAGYSLQNGKWHDPSGTLLTIEMVDDSPAFARINNPYVENLIAAGFETTYTQIDAAQMQQRQEDFDYDIIIGRLVMSLSPSLSLRTIFGSAGASNKGTANYSGVADPGVDALIERIIASDTREDMQAAVRALDRTLRAMHIWVPQWYKGSHNIAYWDVFGRPETKPLFDRGVMSTWWIDTEKMDRLKAEGAL